jgi:hypothetical protein
VKNGTLKTRVIFFENLMEINMTNTSLSSKESIKDLLTKEKVMAFNNEELLESSSLYVQNERQAYEFTNWHFLEIQNRKLYISMGYESLYKMLIGFYKYCETSAYQRVRVIHLVEELPVVANALNSGELSITNLDRAQSFIKTYEKKNNEVLNSSEKLELIENIKNKTTTQAKEYFARLNPETTLPIDQIKYLNEKHIQLTWTLEKEILEKINHLKSLISHENISPTNYELLNLALDAAIEKIEKKKGLYDKPQKIENLKVKSNKKSLVESKGTIIAKTKRFSLKRSRYISRSVKRLALARANHQCEQVHLDGTRCLSKFQLQFDHMIPFSKGGSSSFENIQVLCRVHNDFKSNY